MGDEQHDEENSAGDCGGSSDRLSSCGGGVGPGRPPADPQSTTTHSAVSGPVVGHRGCPVQDDLGRHPADHRQRTPRSRPRQRERAADLRRAFALTQAEWPGLKGYGPLISADDIAAGEPDGESFHVHLNSKGMQTMMVRRSIAAAAAAAAASAGLMGILAPSAQASCASFWGLGGGAQCSSTFGNSAVALGETSSAHADGGFANTAIASGENAEAVPPVASPTPPSRWGTTPPRFLPGSSPPRLRRARTPPPSVPGWQPSCRHRGQHREALGKRSGDRVAQPGDQHRWG